eukprot:Gb_18407 [translate_table: standard]
MATSSLSVCPSTDQFNHYNPPSTQMAFHNNKYRVFLSFRGTDVRKSLVDHLYQSLVAAGISTFLDSEELEKAHDIQSSLEKAIEESEIYIPIFSTNYAESSWCLEELSVMCSHISKPNSTHKLIPLFYQIEPWQVRYPDNERSPYANAFHDHSTRARYTTHTISKWKNALKEASSLSGWSLDTTSGYEGKLVKQVLMDILKTSNNGSLDVAKQPVGLKERFRLQKPTYSHCESLSEITYKSRVALYREASPFPEEQPSEISNLRGFKCCDFMNVVPMEPLARMKNMQFLWLENVQLVDQEKTQFPPKLKCLLLHKCCDVLELPTLPEGLVLANISGLSGLQVFCLSANGIPEWLQVRVQRMMKPAKRSLGEYCVLEDAKCTGIVFCLGLVAYQYHETVVMNISTEGGKILREFPMPFRDFFDEIDEHEVGIVQEELPSIIKFRMGDVIHCSSSAEIVGVYLVLDQNESDMDVRPPKRPRVTSSPSEWK